jgi:hypothetical protein
MDAKPRLILALLMSSVMVAMVTFLVTVPCSISVFNPAFSPSGPRRISSPSRSPQGLPS